MQFFALLFQVLPSQRQATITKLYDVWMCVNKEDAWVLTGNCSCMAGLGSAYSHIAALLFKLETAVHLKLKESTAPTSMLCFWKSCKKAVHPAPLKSINFSRAKTCELPGNHCENISSTLKHYGTKNPFGGKFLLRHEKVQNFFNINPEAAFFKGMNTEEFTGSA